MAKKRKPVEYDAPLLKKIGAVLTGNARKHYRSKVARKPSTSKRKK